AYRDAKRSRWRIGGPWQAAAFRALDGGVVAAEARFHAEDPGSDDPRRRDQSGVERRSLGQHRRSPIVQRPAPRPRWLAYVRRRLARISAEQRADGSGLG